MIKWFKSLFKKKITVEEKNTKRRAATEKLVEKKAASKPKTPRKPRTKKVIVNG